MSTKKAIGGSLGAISILIIAQVLAHIIGSLVLFIKVPEGICNIMTGVLYLILAFFLLKFFAKKILKMDLESLGIPKFNIKGKWLIVAIALPLMVTDIYLLLPGEYVSSNMNGMKIFSTLSAGIFFSGIAAGFVEEMVFRGFVLNLFKLKWNIKIAIIIPSVVFGAIHIIGMNFSLLSIVLVLIAGTLVGIMFSLIAIEANSVWNSGIVHALWNIIIIGGGLTISESPNEHSVITYVLESNYFAITGGEFGIESSIIAICGYVLVILLVIFMLKKSKLKVVNKI